MQVQISSKEKSGSVIDGLQHGETNPKYVPHSTFAYPKHPPTGDPNTLPILPTSPNETQKSIASLLATQISERSLLHLLLRARPPPART